MTTYTQSDCANATGKIRLTNQHLFESATIYWEGQWWEGQAVNDEGETYTDEICVLTHAVMKFGKMEIDVMGDDEIVKAICDKENLVIPQ